MGQYYRAVVKNKTVGKVCWYTYGLKLMEHSWWNNTHMQFISLLIYKTPSQVCWVGDYASEPDDWENEKQKRQWYEFAWGDRDRQKTKPNKTSENAEGISLNGKYLVNHSQKIYLDCDEYYKKCVRDIWCIHPLSLLTAKGNGRGCGDYHECYSCYDIVGSWALDLISVEDEIPKGFKKVEYTFVEE